MQISSSSGSRVTDLNFLPYMQMMHQSVMSKEVNSVPSHGSGIIWVGGVMDNIILYYLWWSYPGNCDRSRNFTVLGYA